MSEVTEEVGSRAESRETLKSWVAPTVTFEESIEVIAAVCAPGKAPGAPFPVCANNPNS